MDPCGKLEVNRRPLGSLWDSTLVWACALKVLQCSTVQPCYSLANALQ